jgi:hypothetical protein
MEYLEEGLELTGLSEDHECDNCGSSPAGANPYCLDEYLCESCYDSHKEYKMYSEWLEENQN